MSFSLRPSVGPKAISSFVIATLALGIAIGGCNVSVTNSDPGKNDNNKASGGGGGGGVLFYAFKSQDPLTGQPCWTDPHRYPADQKEQYCKDLKDDTTNNKCAASARRQYYLRDCGSDFPQVDPTPVPTPTPTPTPTATPTAPSTSDRPAVALELIAAGIEVRTPDIGGAPSAGEASFRTRLSRFWPVVEAKKQEILSRKGLIKVLSLTDRAQYDSAEKSLELAVNFSAADLSRYVKLIDRRVALATNAGVTFNFGVDIERNTAPDFKRAEAATAFFESQSTTIHSFTGLMRTVSLENSTARLYLEEGQLVLPLGSYESDFKSASARLAPLAAFARYAADQRLKLETAKSAGSGSHIELLSDDVSRLASVFGSLDREHAALEDLITRGALSRLFLSPVEKFDIAGGVFTIPLTDDGLARINSVVKAVSTFETVAAIFSNVTVERKQADLDASYIEAVDRMDAFKDLIKSKLSKITRIVLANSASNFADGVLTIGSDGKAADLEKIIKNIKI